MSPRADELDDYAPGAAALITGGDDGRVQSRELVHPDDPTHPHRELAAADRQSPG